MSHDTFDTRPSWLPRGSSRAAEREFEAVDRAMDFDPAFEDEESDETPSATHAAPEYITVELSAKACKPRNPQREDDGVIFTENHPDHPDGQVVVVKGRCVRVARTERVRQAIANGLLVVASEPVTPVMSSEDLLHEVERSFAALPRTWLEESPAATATQPAETPAPPAPHVQRPRATRDKKR